MASTFFVGQIYLSNGRCAKKKLCSKIRLFSMIRTRLLLSAPANSLLCSSDTLRRHRLRAASWRKLRYHFVNMSFLLLQLYADKYHWSPKNTISVTIYVCYYQILYMMLFDNVSDSSLPHMRVTSSSANGIAVPMPRLVVMCPSVTTGSADMDAPVSLSSNPG